MQSAFKENELLRSIIDRAIASIDENRMNALILDVATQIDRKVTVQMVLDSYGPEIFGLIMGVMVILLISVIHNVRAKNELRLQYERYQILAQTSNEYLYEYYVKTNRLELTTNCIELFGDGENLEKLKMVFPEFLKSSETAPVIELTTAAGEVCFFKSVSSPIFDEKGRPYSIIGKLIDVSREETEKQELIRKSETDGMTGLYNSSTARRLIAERLASAPVDAVDALL